MDFKSLLSQLDNLNEASTINGKELKDTDLVWKQTSMSYEEAVKKYGKEHVRKKDKNRLGDDIVEVHTTLKEGRSDEADDDYDAEAEAEKAAEKAEAKRKAKREEIDEGIMDEPETTDTSTGRVHKAKPGGYGRKDDTDDEGKKVKGDAPKRGRGRPKKDADSVTGEVNKPDWSAFGVTKKDVKLPKWDKSKTTKHSLKEWVEEIENKYVAEAEQIQIKPASQMPKTPGQSSMGQQQRVQGQPQKNTQVIQQGNRTLGTVDNPQLAQQIKQSIGKGEMTLMPGEEMTEAGYSAKAARAGKDIGKPGKQFAKIAKSAGEKYGSKESGEKVAGAVLAKLRGKTNEGEFTQHYKPEPTKKQGLGSKIAGAAKKVFDKVAPGDEELLNKLAKDSGGKRQVKEADIPTDQNDMGAGLGAGRSQKTLEGKKPDFLDLDKDGNKKESMKKAASDKKKIKEGAEHRLKAAHHRGKAHALAKESYNCKYDDLEEVRMYHEGFKEGLDECYGQMSMAEGVLGTLGGAALGGALGGPVGAAIGAVGGQEMTRGGSTLFDESDETVVDDMASFGADDEVEEGNAFTGALARTPNGGKFTIGGKSFTDRSGYDATFESWDKELSNLLTENEKVDEGMTVSISKGQQGMPDSVSISATDSDSDELLALVKQAGIGGFGGTSDSSSEYSNPVTGNTDTERDIEVVGDHDDMMSLMRKVGGQDYADEEHDHEETCEVCGSADCGCEEEMVDEVESEDQMMYQVAEDNPPDSGAEETAAEDQEIAADNAAASSHGGAQNSNLEEESDEDEAHEDEEDEEETVEESYANSADDTFESDIDFMTKVITGGLNKQKIDVAGNGQSTIPVTATRPMKESTDLLTDWKKLSGIR